MPDDIQISWNEKLMTGDVEVDSGDLISEDGLETAVLISLFTDRRARDDDTLPDLDSDDKRGWWGDLANPDVEGDQIGSRLWLLQRAKTTQEVLVRAEGYVKEALQWMIDDGIAVKIDVDAERQIRDGGDMLAFKVMIYKKSGVAESVKFEYQWEGTGNAI